MCEFVGVNILSEFRRKGLRENMVKLVMMSLRIPIANKAECVRLVLISN
jgi:hypothetical protein